MIKILNNPPNPPDNTEALQALREAVRLSPLNAETHYALGIALHKLGQLSDAMASYHEAIKVKPDFAPVYSSLGDVMIRFGQYDNAVTCNNLSLGFNPNDAKTHHSLGIALGYLKRLDEAVASYRNAIALKPDYVEAYSNLGLALCYLGRYDEAIIQTQRALQLKPDHIEARGTYLFIHNFLPDFHPDHLLAEARCYGELVTKQATPYTSWHNSLEPDRCLRIGMVSGDLGNHPVGYVLEHLLPALRSRSSGRLELFAYLSMPREGPVTERIRAACHHWHSVIDLSDQELAQRIRNDGIDILLDLSGHTAYNRLPMFAWKPAPIQASWLGYSTTTGVAAIDYFITDPWGALETDDPWFTEKLWRMPDIGSCYAIPDFELSVSPLPALTNGTITFGNLNNLSKMNGAVIALWAQLLQAVPGSRLLLKAKQLNTASRRQSMADHFASYGVTADQLILEGSDLRKDHLAAYQRVDISLDPFPYPGSTLTAESLWMGVPVLTLAGDRALRPLSRTGVSLLMNAGLPEWIATDTHDYLTRAVTHATDLPRLASLRSQLREQVLASPIFDAARFARHFEIALRGMWTQWCLSQTK